MKKRLSQGQILSKVQYILVILKTPKKPGCLQKRQSNGTWVSFYGKLTSIVAVLYFLLLNVATEPNVFSLFFFWNSTVVFVSESPKPRL